MNPTGGMPLTPRPAKALVLWIGIAVIAIAAAILAWYYYSPSWLPAGPDAATLKLESQGTSDEVSAIEQDLSATDLTDLDKELSDIEAELAPQ